MSRDDVTGSIAGDDAALKALLLQAAAGSTAAFGSLYDLAAGRVHAMSLRLTPDHAAAEEATLRAFTTAWSRAPSYDPDQHPLHWMMTIAVHAIVGSSRS